MWTHTHTYIYINDHMQRQKNTQLWRQLEAPSGATQLDVWGMGFGKNFSYGMDDHTTYV